MVLTPCLQWAKQLLFSDRKILPSVLLCPDYFEMMEKYTALLGFWKNPARNGTVVKIVAQCDSRLHVSENCPFDNMRKLVF